MAKAKFRKPIEGEVYGFPLDDGRYGVAVLARVETAKPRKPYGIFVYIFGPFANKIAASKNLGRLEPSARVARLKSGALGIYLGDWTYVGVIPNWKRDEWSFPDFYSRAYQVAPLVKVTISEVDMVTCLEHVPIAEIGDLEENSLYGSEAARREASRRMQNLPTIVTRPH